MDLDGRPDLVFQPIVRLDDGRLIGFEALLRWYNSKGEAISPVVVLPEAEARGDMPSLHGWVIAEACAQAATWAEPLPVAVNCSIFELRRGGVADAAARSIASSGIDPGRLWLEVTETALLDMHTHRDLLAVLRLGVRLSVDDVAWGWTPTGHPIHASVRSLKIDGPLVRHVDGHEGASTQAAIEAIVAASRALGAFTVAEGVETSKQAELLRQIGVDSAQGFWFSKPVPATRAVELAKMDPLPTFPRREGADRQAVLDAQVKIRSRRAVANPSGSLRPLSSLLGPGMGAKGQSVPDGGPRIVAPAHARSSVPTPAQAVAEVEAQVVAQAEVQPSPSRAPAHAARDVCEPALVEPQVRAPAHSASPAGADRDEPYEYEAHAPLEELQAQVPVVASVSIDTEAATTSYMNEMEPGAPSPLGDASGRVGLPSNPGSDHTELGDSGSGSFMAMEVLDALREVANAKSSSEATVMTEDLVLTGSEQRSTRLSRRSRRSRS